MILLRVSNEIWNKNPDERNNEETYLFPQLSVHNPDADMGKTGQRAKKPTLRSYITVVPKWARVHETSGGFSG